MREDPDDNTWASRPRRKLTPEIYNSLTERQKQVLPLMADGMSNKQIARALSISTFTAKAHASAVLQRLGVESRVQVAAMWTEWLLSNQKCA